MQGSVKGAKARFKQRQQALELEKVDILRKKQAEKKEKEEKYLQNRVHLTRELTEIGGIWSVPDVEITKFPNDDMKFKAVICQLKFHKQVLKSKGPAEYFQKTCKGTKYSLEEKLSHLREILELNSINDDGDKDKSDIRDKGRKEMVVVQGRIEEEKTKLLFKLNEQRTKLKVKRSRDMLSTFVAEPQKLVGSCVRHKMKYNNEIKWFTGKVVDLVVENGLTSTYEIIYDETEDDEDNNQEKWQYPLLVDIKNEDLIIQ
ncbi:hypothetical protein HOLleu_03875 [Holothuria leucospilota]|uniref:Uncharacterized protein n=1 Tax=Holothuria leucospilota TaxID=206669 RepID=A0A9Q1HLK3_HOLLE|nr:hypothetical protein HOLleu_03875 [Holothuria leucospilota]